MVKSLGLIALAAKKHVVEISTVSYDITSLVTGDTGLITADSSENVTSLCNFVTGITGDSGSITGDSGNNVAMIIVSGITGDNTTITGDNGNNVALV